MESKRLIKKYIKKQFVIRYLILNFLFFIAVVLDYGLNGIIVDVIELFSRPLAEFIVEFNRPLMILFYVVGIYLICMSSIKKAQNHLEIIINSIEKIPNASAKIPAFPKELKNVEIEVKDIQHTIYRNEQIAKEAEQRKNDLVVYLAHDLKTPLTSIIGYLSLLDESPELPEESREKFTSITLDKAYRLEQLINEFFDITRFNLQNIELDKNHINLSVMLSQIVDEFYPLFDEKGLSIETNIESEISIVADADKLARVFDNIIRNAISYSYSDTCLYLTASTNETQDGVIIKLRNTGDEIPEEKLNRIFEKFFRLDSARSTRKGGAGLGLAIAKQIVELHGGSIGAISCEEYTEFIIEFPLSPVRKNFVSNSQECLKTKNSFFR